MCDTPRVLASLIHAFELSKPFNGYRLSYQPRSAQLDKVRGDKRKSTKTYLWYGEGGFSRSRQRNLSIVQT